MKRLAGNMVKLLPKPLQQRIVSSYWLVKSEFLYRYLYRLLKLEYRLKSGINVNVASLGEWWTYNDIFVNREYDPAILAVLSSCEGARPLVVLDLGANVGYFALRLADMISDHAATVSGYVVLVEGSPQNFEELSRRMRAQQLPRLNYQLVHGLVGQKSGEGAIRESAIHVKNTLVESGRGARKVSFVDLNTIMGRGPIDLLKCDIEGSELAFIESYPELLLRVRTAVFELHHGLCDTSKCRALLSSLGFQELELRGDNEVSVTLFTRENISEPGTVESNDLAI